MSYLEQSGQVAAAAAVELRVQIPVAGDPLDRDSNRASAPYPDRGDADHAVLALPGSLVQDQEDPGDPWDRDRAAVAPSAHEGRDCRLQSLPARKVPLPQAPEVALGRVLAAVAVVAVAAAPEQVLAGADPAEARRPASVPASERAAAELPAAA